MTEKSKNLKQAAPFHKNARQGKAELGLLSFTSCEAELQKYKILNQEQASTIDNLKTLLLKEKEINLNLQMENENLRAKFATMEFAQQKIEEHFKYLERNMKNYEYITKSQEVFLKLEKQKTAKLASEKKKIAKEKAEVNFKIIDQELHDLKNLLKNSESEECKSLHKQVISGLDNVQKSLIGLKFEVIESSKKIAERDVKIQDLEFSMKNMKERVDWNRKNWVLRLKHDAKVLKLQGLFALENKELMDKLHKQGANSPSFDYLQKMPEVFKLGIETFNQKLETLFQNLNFTTENNLFQGWLQALRDFVGKSIGEVAAIKRWLLFPCNS